MHRCRLATTLFASLLLLAGAESRTDPASGQVRVIMLGEIGSSNEIFLQWIEDNPKFTLKRIACSTQITESVREGRRLVRVYMPRTEEDLHAGIDAAVFEDFSPIVIPITYLDWFQNSVAKGMGIALIEYVNWGGANEIHKWMALEFYGLFPADCLLNDIPAVSGRTFYSIVNENGPISLPGIESVAMNSGHHGDLRLRQASTVEARWRGRGTPAMVTSAYGRGNTLQLAHGWDNIPTRDYRYMPDYIYHTLFYISGIPYPDDLELVHNIREDFIAYNFRKRATLAVLEFVERFGANPSEAEARLDAMGEDYRQASELYLVGEFPQAKDTLGLLIDEFSEVDASLMEAKDRALVWIYLIEWLAVSGVGLLCGSILWMVMVRRKLYRSVKTTRIG